MTTTATETTERFYVTVQDAGKTGFLLGPYDTHAEALANVGHGRKLAEAATSRAVFYAFGTTKVTGAKAARTVFGKETP